MRMRLPILRTAPPDAFVEQRWAELVAAADEQMIAHGAATSVCGGAVGGIGLRRRYRWRVAYPIGEIVPGQMETTAHEGRAFTSWGASYARSRYDGSRDRARYLGLAAAVGTFAMGMAAANILGVLLGYWVAFAAWATVLVGSVAITQLGRQIVRARTDVTCVHPEHPGYGRGEAS